MKKKKKRQKTKQNKKEEQKKKTKKKNYSDPPKKGLYEAHYRKTVGGKNTPRKNDHKNAADSQRNTVEKKPLHHDAVSNAKTGHHHTYAHIKRRTRGDN